jgi:hypothetical protein
VARQPDKVVGTWTHRGDGSSMRWPILVRVAVFGGGRRLAANSGGGGVICQLGGRGKTVRRGLINDEMHKTVEMTE